MKSIFFRKGFTLVEVVVATALVALAVVSLLAANIAFTRSNGFGADLSTAEFLLEQLRERTALMSYEQLEGGNFGPYSPPINSDGQPLNDFAAFTQELTVENVSAADFSQVVADGASDFIRLTAKIKLNGAEVTSASWIRARY